MNCEESKYLDIHGLGAEISAKTGISKGDAEAFVLALTRYFHDVIGAKGIVELPGLGSFRYLGNGMMEFESAARLADEVNSTFSMFSPVELPEGAEAILDDDAEGGPVTDLTGEPVASSEISEGLEIDEDLVSEGHDIEKPAMETDETELPKPGSTEADVIESQDQEVAQSGGITDTAVQVIEVQDRDSQQPVSKDSETNIVDTKENAWAQQNAEEPGPYETEIESRGKRLPAWFLYILGIATGFAAAACVWWFYYSDYVGNSIGDPMPCADSINVAQMNVTRLIVNGCGVNVQDTLLSDSLLAKDQVAKLEKDESLSDKAEGQPEKAPEVVTDTITSRKFLTTLAKKHYGKKNYWVFIYQENKSRLRHPDRISPGTVVVIPPIEKYVIPGSHEDSVKRATSRLTGEIYSRYR